MKKLFSLIALLCLCVSGAWAEVTTYTWDFTNTTTWTAAKIATGESVTLGTSATTPAAGEYGVTFNLSDALVANQAASGSVVSKGLWFKANGSATTENVSIVVPDGFRVVYNLVYGSNTRPFVYTKDNGTTTTNLSSGNLDYTNNTGADVTVSLWASNCVRTASGITSYQNCITSIVLYDLTSGAINDVTVKHVANIGGMETILHSTTIKDVQEGHNYNVVADKVLSYGGKYYELNDANYSDANFTKVYTMGGTATEVKVNYSLAEDIVYYGEWETDFSSGSSNYGVTNNGKLSNGQGRIIKRTDTSMSLTFNISAGQYMITMPSYNDDSKTRDAAIKIDDEAEDILSVTTKAYKTYSKNNVILNAGNHTVNVRCTYNLTPAIDYILIRKTGEVSTISAAGYTTFSSTSNIDADAITGGKAYVINSFDAENVTLTQATGIVPANTGMIIAGEGGNPASAGTVTIPVSTADATFDTSNNLLVACATATTVQAAAAGKKNYVLAYDAADAANTIGFYYIGSTSATVAAGKAYLTVDEATPAKMFRFSTGNTTGIKAVSNEMTANKAVKRIMNGQLVIEKAGKMFNAAGAEVK